MLGASYDERWLSLKRNLFLFLAGWLAGTTEPSISNLYLSPVHHDEQKALATTGMSRILPQLRQKLTAKWFRKWFRSVRTTYP